MNSAKKQNIKLVTDTSANLPREIIEKYKIEVIPFNYTVNGEHVDQTADFDGPTFYNAMREGADVRTSMINPDAYRELFERLLPDCDGIIYIAMSGGISGSANAARIAADEIRESFRNNPENPENNKKIAVIDSLGASLGEGMQVIEAAELLLGGYDIDTVVAEVTSHLQNMCQYFTVDDLCYLHKGGRLSGGSAVIGSLLKIKPILMGNSEGKIVSCDKVRGRKASIDALAEKYDRLVFDKRAAVGIAHADDSEAAAALLQKLAEKGFEGECLTVCYEPVTGSHVGPGTLALFFRGIHK